MSTRNVFCATICLSVLLRLFSATTAQSAPTDAEMSNQQVLEELSIQELTNQIRRDKFDIILPQIMREQGIDMWIHVMRRGGAYSFNDVAYGIYAEFGDTTGVYIFTDRGGDRIERAVLGRRWKRGNRDPIKECKAYDIVGEPIRPRESAADKDTEFDRRFEGIGEFVAKRDPKRIAVNYIDELGPTVCADSNDGISHSDFRLLVKELGEKYASRIVSSEYLEINYISRPVPSELVMLKRIRNWTVERLERDFAKIVPGVTTFGDIEGYSVLMRPERSGGDGNYALKGGDLFIIESGFEAEYDVGSHWQFGNFFEMNVEYGYVLREGETGLPPQLKKLWSDGMKIRKVVADNIKVGRTGRETFTIIKKQLDEAGFIVNTHQDFYANLDPEKTQVSIDLHALGKGRNAPRIGSIGPDWEHEIPLPLYHHFVMEMFIYMPYPESELEQKYLSLWFHDGAIVTENGVEFLGPPPSEIHIIH